METTRPQAFYPGFGGSSERDNKVTYEELLSICLRNAANAYVPFAMEGENVMADGRSMGRTITEPSDTRYVNMVLVLYLHVRRAWRTDELRKAYDDMKGEADANTPKISKFMALHEEILELLAERHILEPTKTPRTLIE